MVRRAGCCQQCNRLRGALQPGASRAAPEAEVAERRARHAKLDEITKLLCDSEPNEYLKAVTRFDWRMANGPATINKESTNENNTDVDRWEILAGCGSMENDVRNHGVASTSPAPLPDPGDTIAVDTICACP